MRVEDAGTAALERLVEDLADIRHDLGKYVCFETRFVGTEAPELALREALQADLQRTRCRTLPDGEALTETAWALWARLRPVDLEGDPDVLEIDSLIGRLQSADLKANLGGLRQTAEVALAVSAATRRLLDRGRAALARTQGGAHG